jgi:anti-sigma factor RsiW
MTLDDQIQAYLDGTATEADLQAVHRALRDNPTAAHLLARHTLLRELLEDEYAGDYLLPAEPPPAPTATATHRPIRSGWLPQFAGTVALLLLIGLAGCCDSSHRRSGQPRCSLAEAGT